MELIQESGSLSDEVKRVITLIPNREFYVLVIPEIQLLNTEILSVRKKLRFPAYAKDKNVRQHYKELVKAYSALVEKTALENKDWHIAYWQSQSEDMQIRYLREMIVKHRLLKYLWFSEGRG